MGKKRKSAKPQLVHKSNKCVICPNVHGLTQHHVYSRKTSEFSITLCACCHNEYNKEATKGVPGLFTKLVWEYVIAKFGPGAENKSTIKLKALSTTIEEWNKHWFAQAKAAEITTTQECIKQISKKDKNL